MTAIIDWLQCAFPCRGIAWIVNPNGIAATVAAKVVFVVTPRQRMQAAIHRDTDTRPTGFTRCAHKADISAGSTNVLRGAVNKKLEAIVTVFAGDPIFERNVAGGKISDEPNISL